MTTSGFCNPSHNAASHDRCRMGTCDCSCHEVDARIVMVSDQAELVDVEYRSPEWHQARLESIAASEIASVLGISPWVSPFDLWWLKRSGADSQTENKDMRRGRRYEALILEDFADEHPEFHVGHSVTARNIHRPYQLATPDALAFEKTTSCTCDAGGRCDKDNPVASIEAKTGQRHEWGDPGSDDIPVHYRAQVLWQMDTLGVPVTYMPVLFGDQYVEYVVEYDEADVTLMRAAAEAFLQSVREDRQPDIDGHVATVRRLKKLHPKLTDDEAVVPATIVRQYQRAKATRDAAQERMRLAEARVRALAGPAARIAITDGDGKTRTFSHSITAMNERTQTVRAHTRDQINWPRKAIS